MHNSRWMQCFAAVMFASTCFSSFQLFFWTWRPTLEGAGRLLSKSEVFLRQMVDRLVLVDLHTGAYVALAMQEESEGAG